MDSILLRAGGWLALAFLAFAAMVAAVDSGFAIHMGIIIIACLIALWVTISKADYQAIGRGIIKAPPDEGLYDDDPIRWGVIATIFWGMAGFLAGLYIALQLAFPVLNLGLEYTTFGRLRPLHTSAVIFAFGGNALIATSYYIVQRTCRARLAFPGLARFVFWGYQLFIVLAATGYLLGITQSKEYAEPEWYVDLWLTIVWVAYAVVFIGTIVKRSEPHIYVANWFLLSFILTVAMLHVVNGLALPVSLLGAKSYSAFAGVQDALTQWWYGHNAVGFFLTAGFLGMMYYFVPKQAERPVYSYRLSIIHFWSLIFLYIWAGPHHLHYTALPDWAQTLGMVFSIVLWMPSWGGMINGLMTLNGAWEKIRTDPIIRMMVLSLAFYGMSTFEGPMMSIKAVNSLSHYTDWTIGHVHSGALGWNGMITFAAIYYLVPRLWGQTAPLQSAHDQLALLARDHGHRALRRLDVGCRYHAGPAVAGIWCRWISGLLVQRSGDGDAAHVPDPRGRRPALSRWCLRAGLQCLDDDCRETQRDEKPMTETPHDPETDKPIVQQPAAVPAE